jgi:hypothetical protein
VWDAMVCSQHSAGPPTLRRPQNRSRLVSRGFLVEKSTFQCRRCFLCGAIPLCNSTTRTHSLDTPTRSAISTFECRSKCSLTISLSRSPFLFISIFYRIYAKVYVNLFFGACVPHDPAAAICAVEPHARHAAVPHAAAPQGRPIRPPLLDAAVPAPERFGVSGQESFPAEKASRAARSNASNGSSHISPKG